MYKTELLELTPVIEETRTLHSVISIFEQFKDEPNAVLLDSADLEREDSGFSYIAFDPFIVLKSRKDCIKVVENGAEQILSGNPFDELKKILNRFSSPDLHEVAPFTVGAIGYFGYDLKDFIEDIPDISEDDQCLPDCVICFYNKVIIFDHVKELCFISCCPIPGNAKVADESSAHAAICDIKNRIEAAVRHEHIPDYSTSSILSHEFSQRYLADCNFSKQKYHDTVKKAMKYIESGDIFQVNISQRFHCSIDYEPWRLYKYLHHVNPAPYGLFMDFDDVVIASSSPESFLAVSSDHAITTPMKGTRPRGRTQEEDERLKVELLESDKDKAELAMIVDMERNDLGRVCEIGSVKVADERVIETHKTVFQAVARVAGVLSKEKDRIDLIKAAFPGGSITGAPKIRAMEIIDELEPTKRNIYTGSAGFISFSGTMSLNILIRTIVIKNEELYFQVGGGIVSDSDPEKEYLETLDKARAMVYAIEQAGKNLRNTSSDHNNR